MAFLGMRGTGDWSAAERPENWRQSILYLYPNGSAPLTAMLSMLKSEQVNDPKYHWWTKKLPEQSGAATGVYTDPALSTPYVSGGVAGNTVYVQTSAEVASEFRRGHNVYLQKEGDDRYDTFGEVVSSIINGASSYIGVKLLEAANATYDLDDVDFISIVGNSNAEGATIPDVIAYDPVQYTNVTQIFRTPLSMTRTAMRTTLRTGDQKKEAKREALELHAIEMEKAFIWSKMTETTGTNGKPKRTTAGLIPTIKQFAPAENINDYTRNADYTGLTWVQGGEDWLDERLEYAFRYGNNEKMALCGNAALRAINKLAKVNGDIQLTPMSASYGLQVIRWITPFGTIYFKTHPLFSHHSVYRNHMVIFDLDRLGSRYIDDTFYKADDSVEKNTNSSRDGKEEEYLTEIGFEWAHPETMSYLTGVGLNNNLS